MPEYIRYPIETDPDVLLQDYIDELRAYWPNWEAAEGSLAYRGAAALIRMVAEGRDVASLVPDAIFRAIGKSLFNYPANEAEAAVADTTWTARDNAGYGPIPAGTIVSINGVFFETDDDITFLSGSTVVTPVGITAIEKGAAGSGLGAPAAVITLEEGYEYVASVALVSATDGGADAEDIQAYQTRLRNYLTLLTPRAITAENLRVLVQTVTGIELAVALKGYNPADNTWDNEGMAAIAVRDALGLQVPLAIKNAAAALLLGPSDRLVNGVINMIDPTWTPVDISYAGVCLPGKDPAVILAMADGALANLTDPSQWGLPQSGEDRKWNNKTFIRLSDVYGALDNVEGMDYVDHASVTIGLNGGAQVNDDVELPGVVPLPTTGVIAGVVTLP
jgi:hypothetical protein